MAGNISLEQLKDIPQCNHGNVCVLKTGTSNSASRGKSFFICNSVSERCSFAAPAKSFEATVCGVHNKMVELKAFAKKDAGVRCYYRCVLGKEKGGTWCGHQLISSTEETQQQQQRQQTNKNILTDVTNQTTKTHRLQSKMPSHCAEKRTGTISPVTKNNDAVITSSSSCDGGKSLPTGLENTKPPPAVSKLSAVPSRLASVIDMSKSSFNTSRDSKRLSDISDASSNDSSNLSNDESTNESPRGPGKPTDDDGARLSTSSTETPRVYGQTNVEEVEVGVGDMSMMSSTSEDLYGDDADDDLVGDAVESYLVEEGARSSDVSGSISPDLLPSHTDSRSRNNSRTDSNVVPRLRSNSHTEDAVARSRHNSHTDDTGPISCNNSHTETQKKCLGRDCDFYGADEYGGMCSSCFLSMTIEQSSMSTDTAVRSRTSENGTTSKHFPPSSDTVFDVPKSAAVDMAARSQTIAKELSDKANKSHKLGNIIEISDSSGDEETDGGSNQVHQPSHSTSREISEPPLFQQKQQPTEKPRSREEERSFSNVDPNLLLSRVHNLEDQIRRQQDVYNKMGSLMPDSGRKLMEHIRQLHKDLEKSRKDYAECQQHRKVHGSMPINMHYPTLKPGASAMTDPHTMMPHGQTYGQRAAPLFGGRMTDKRLKEVGAITAGSIEQLHKSLDSRPGPTTEADDPKQLKVTLMSHQKQAIAWLMWREKQNPSGGILADDMGLGKTLTMISLSMKSKQVCTCTI